jgi:predicted DNA-binding transcriptional regulator YafY
VDPLGLVAKGSVWYLVARSGDALRTYRVSRIEDARLLDAPSVRPPGFDLAEHWRASWQRFDETLPRFDATLHLEPRAARWVQMSRPVVAVVDGPADPPGWVALRVQFDHEDEAVFYALGLGPRAAVLEPATLRAHVLEQARAVVARDGA